MRYAILMAVAALVACGGDDGPTGNQPPEGDITVGNNFFDPGEYLAEVGVPVVWAWAPEAVVHNVVFDDGAPGSEAKSSGTFERTFSALGEFPYHCSIHGADVMSGVVRVVATGGGGGDGGGDRDGY